MKITFVLPYAGLSGGVRVVAIYADHLQRHGHEVTVVSVPRRPMTFKQKIKKLFKEKKWPVHGPGPSHFDGHDVRHLVLDTCRPVTDRDVPEADVIIATWWETAEWVAALSKNKGEKFYFIQGHEVHDHLPIERVRKTYSLPLQKIVISRWLVDVMAKEYHAYDVALVPNSVDLAQFYAGVRGRQSMPTVGFMYSDKSFKGCDIIIEALNKVRSYVPTLKIIAFGACRPGQNLSLPQGTDFYYKPPQKKISTIYSSCDFWIFGSREEGFGLPLLEAMACRTPLIATPAGAAPELLESGGGILLDSWDVDRMTDAICQAMDMQEMEWLDMARRARKTAASYSWEDATRMFEKALQK